MQLELLEPWQLASRQRAGEALRARIGDLQCLSPRLLMLRARRREHAPHDRVEGAVRAERALDGREQLRLVIGVEALGVLNVKTVKVDGGVEWHDVDALQLATHLEEGEDLVKRKPSKYAGRGG